jgi:hypothetical protein
MISRFAALSDLTASASRCTTHLHIRAKPSEMAGLIDRAVQEGQLGLSPQATIG